MTTQERSGRVDLAMLRVSYCPGLRLWRSDREIVVDMEVEYGERHGGRIRVAEKMIELSNDDFLLDALAAQLVHETIRRARKGKA